MQPSIAELGVGLMAVISELGRLRQEKYEFKASLVYIVKAWLNQTKPNQTRFQSCNIMLSLPQLVP